MIQWRSLRKTVIIGSHASERLNEVNIKQAVYRHRDSNAPEGTSRQNDSLLQSTKMFKLSNMKSLISLILSLSPVSSELLCRPEGPVVPRPVSLSSSPDFLSAARNLSENFSRALNGTIRAGFPTDNVSFSVSVVSLAQDDPAVPLWEYHHLSAANVNGTKELDRNSQYLIGSVSKVLSDAILLKSGLSLDDSITKYLPELASSNSPVRWENISLGALASQLSGIPPNYGFSEFYYLEDYFESLGFPPLNDSDYAPCGVQALNPGCTSERESRLSSKHTFDGVSRSNMRC